MRPPVDMTLISPIRRSVPPGRSHRLGSLLWGGLLWGAAGVLAAGCSSSPPGGEATAAEKFPRVFDGRKATGIGCGETESAALQNARKLAHYNLRALTGSGSYKVVFMILEEVEDPDRSCVKVEARTATPSDSIPNGKDVKGR